MIRLDWLGDQWPKKEEYGDKKSSYQPTRDDRSFIIDLERYEKNPKLFIDLDQKFERELEELKAEGLIGGSNGVSHDEEWSRSTCKSEKSVGQDRWAGVLSEKE